MASKEQRRSLWKDIEELSVNVIDMLEVVCVRNAQRGEISGDLATLSQVLDEAQQFFQFTDKQRAQAARWLQIVENPRRKRKGRGGPSDKRTKYNERAEDWDGWSRDDRQKFVDAIIIYGVGRRYFPDRLRPSSFLFTISVDFQRIPEKADKSPKINKRD